MLPPPTHDIEFLHECADYLAETVKEFTEVTTELVNNIKNSKGLNKQQIDKMTSYMEAIRGETFDLSHVVTEYLDDIDEMLM